MSETPPPPLTPLEKLQNENQESLRNIEELNFKDFEVKYYSLEIPPDLEDSNVALLKECYDTIYIVQKLSEPYTNIDLSTFSDEDIQAEQAKVIYLTSLVKYFHGAMAEGEFAPLSYQNYLAMRDGGVEKALVKDPDGDIEREENGVVTKYKIIDTVVHEVGVKEKFNIVLPEEDATTVVASEQLYHIAKFNLLDITHTQIGNPLFSARSLLETASKMKNIPKYRDDPELLKAKMDNLSLSIQYNSQKYIMINSTETLEEIYNHAEKSTPQEMPVSEIRELINASISPENLMDLLGTLADDNGIQIPENMGVTLDNIDPSALANPNTKIICSEKIIDSVIQNGVQNALKAALAMEVPPEEVKLQFFLKNRIGTDPKTGEPREEVVFGVRDNGIGTEEEKVTFEKNKSAWGKNKVKGTGTGTFAVGVPIEKLGGEFFLSRRDDGQRGAQLNACFPIVE